jgi:multiple sugar transport system substrate-binding protein
VGIVALLGFTMAQKVNLTYLTHWPPDTVNRLKAAISDYQKDHPDVNITVRVVPFGNLLSTLRAQASSPNGPTIAGIYMLWLPQLVKAGVADPAPTSYASDIAANWPAGVVDSVSVNDNTYGYPNEIDLYALNYNKRLFGEADIAGPPTTWDELIADAKKLTKRDSSGNITQQGFGLINSWAAGVVHPWLSLVYSDGGKMLNGTKAQLTSKQTQAVTDLYHQLIFDDKVTDPALGTANANTTGPYLNSFTSGHTAMIIMANWWEADLQQAMGDNFKDVATAPIPVGPDGSGPHPVSYTWLDMVSTHASDAQKAAAWDFLKWLDAPGSGEGGSSAMGDILMSMGILPSRSSDVKAHADKLSDPFLQEGYVSQLGNAIAFPRVLGGEELTDSLQQWLERMEFGKVSPQEAMQGAQKDIEAILERSY